MTPQPNPGSDDSTVIEGLHRLETHQTMTDDREHQVLREIGHLLLEGHRMTSSRSSLRAELRVLWLLIHHRLSSPAFRLECFQRQDYLRRLLREHRWTLTP